MTYAQRPHPRAPQLVRTTLLAIAALLLALALSACSDSTEPGRGLDGRFAVAGGSASANPFFFVLPPIAAAPTIGPELTFNPSLEPSVRIDCASADRQRPEVTCTTPRIEIAEGIVVEDEAYRLQWHTSQTPLQSSRRYSVKVMIGGTALDSIFIEAVANPNQRNDVPAGYYGFQYGSTIPLKFWIGDGAVCWARYGTADCTELTVPPTGIGLDEPPTCLEDVDKTLCMAFDEDPDGITEVKPGESGTIVPVARTFSMRLIDEIVDPNSPGQRCLNNLPGQYRQALGCYEIVADPALAAFEQFKEGKVWVAYCLDPTVDDEQYTRFKSKSGSPDIPLEEAAPGSVVPGFLVDSQCAAFNERFAVAPSWLRNAFGFVFGRQALASDIDRFSNIRELSRFGWVREIALHADAQGGSTGTINLLAKVESSHAHGRGVAGVAVQFTCTAGPCADASATSAVATSQGSGWAQTEWTLTVAGTYQFTVSTPADGAVPQTFDVIVTAPMTWRATFTPPLVQHSPAALAYQHTGATGAVEVRCVSGSCASGQTLASLPFSPADLLEDDSVVYQVQWRIAGVQDGDQLAVAVVLAGVTLPGSASLIVAGEPRFNVGSTLPLKFRIERP